MRTIISSFTSKELRIICLFLSLIGGGQALTYFFPSEYSNLSFTPSTTRPVQPEEIADPIVPGILESGLIDINLAGEETLDSLPGVGPATAKSIVDWRTKNGGFTKPADLDNVPGIGPSKLDRLLPYVTVSGGIASSVVSAQPPPVVSAPSLVNINTADTATLETLPRVGPAIAKRIIDYRTKNGPFPTVEHISNISGIGPKTLDQLRPHITVR